MTANHLLLRGLVAASLASSLVGCGGASSSSGTTADALRVGGQAACSFRRFEDGEGGGEFVCPSLGFTQGSGYDDWTVGPLESWGADAGCEAGASATSGEGVTQLDICMLPADRVGDAEEMLRVFATGIAEGMAEELPGTASTPEYGAWEGNGLVENLVTFQYTADDPNDTTDEPVVVDVVIAIVVDGDRAFLRVMVDGVPAEAYTAESHTTRIEWMREYDVAGPTSSR